MSGEVRGWAAALTVACALGAMATPRTVEAQTAAGPLVL